MRHLIPFTSVAILVLFTLAACETRQTETGEMSEEVEDVGLIEESPAEIELDAKNESGVTGTLMLEPLDGDIQVEAMLRGADPATAYVWHAHEGTCDTGGPVAIDLGRIENSPEGVTNGLASVQRSALFEDADYFVQVHSADGAIVACADVIEFSDWATGEPTSEGQAKTERETKTKSGETY